MDLDAVIIEPYRVRGASKVYRVNGAFAVRPKPPPFVQPSSRMGFDATLRYRVPKPTPRRLD
jgi:hypothetical protein